MVRASLHGLTRAAITRAQGGKFSAGFWSGLASSALGGQIGRFKSLEGQTAMAAIVGGTASELGGGKFANGAVSAAFVHMYNDLVHESTKAIHGLHQRISVYDKEGHILYSINFGLPNGSHSPISEFFGGKGVIELEDINRAGLEEIQRLSTSPAEDAKIIQYMYNQVGKTDSYWIVGCNCRNYAQEQFDYIKTNVLGRY